VDGQLEPAQLAVELPADAAHDDGSPPSDERLQATYDSWCAAINEGKVHLEAHQQAKAAGDAATAAEELRTGALANSRQIVLGEEYKRLHKLRPDWKPASRN
jgi:hypothetical protein